jgi:Tol biopolymer transport system component
VELKRTEPGIDRGKIRRQLERLLASPEFARTDRMARFLRYVVEQSVNGPSDALRERQIGIQVFERPPDWDPKLDNIVRSEARRLREKLDAYAASASPDETVRITVPKGSYVAEFADFRPEAVAAIQVPPIPPSQPAPRRYTFFLASAVTVFGIALVLLTSLRDVRANADDFEVAPFSTEAGRQFSPTISPDGKKIAFVWDKAGPNLDVFVKSVSTGAVQRFTDSPYPDIHPAWSPDGRQIAFIRLTNTSMDVMLRSADLGPERKLARIDGITGSWASENIYQGCESPSWSPDAKGLLLTEGTGNSRGYGLIYMSVSTGAKTVITWPPAEDQDCYARFSPDGSRIAFVRYISHGEGEIYIASRDGKDLKRLTLDHRNIRGLDWSIDGKQLVFASNRKGAYELRTMSWKGGESHPLPSDTAAASDPAVARSGNWIAYVESAQNWNIWRVRVEAARGGEKLEQPQRFLASSGQNHSPSFSADGTKLGFVSDRSGNPEIWFANADGTNLRQMTHFGGPWLGTIRWSPDGKNILFDARPNGHAEIFMMPSAGGEPHSLEREDFEDRRPAWSRDGKSIYFDTSRSGRHQIWKRSLDTGVARPIAPPDTLVPVESVDGSTLFYTDSDHHLWTSGTDGSNPMMIPGIRPDPELDWAVSSDAIYYAESDGASAKIYCYRFKDRTIRQVGELAQCLSPGTPSLTISPDGAWLLYAATDYTKSDIRIRRDAVSANIHGWF